MAGKTSKTAWQSMERKHAEFWSKVFGCKVTRVPLSGINSGHNCGDVIVPYDPKAPFIDGKPQKYDVSVECKFRAKNAQHALFEAALDDAKSHGVSNAVLVTRVKNSRSGDLITLHEKLFYDLMMLPGALDLIRKPSGADTAAK